MTQPSETPAAAPTRRRQHAVQWGLRDLQHFATRWEVSPAIVRAAFRSAKVEHVESPEAAEKIVRDFLKLNLGELEQKAAEAHAKEARSGGRK